MAEENCLKVSEDMSYETLEGILDCLPEPTSARVFLYGAFNYSSLSEQASEAVKTAGLVKGISLERVSQPLYNLANVSRERVLQIYKVQQDLEKASEEPERKIYLHDISWLLEVSAQIIVEPSESRVKIKYRYQEPNYIRELRERFSSKDVEFEIGINSDSDLETDPL